MMKYFLLIFMVLYSLISKFWEVIKFSLLIYFYLFIYKISVFLLNEGCVYYFDLMSLMLLVLSCLVCYFMYYSSYNIRWISNMWRYMNILFVTSFLFLILVFMVSSLVYFYILFEMAVVPMFLLVIRFGYQPERWRAGIYLIFYTFFGSIPLMILILIGYKKNVYMLFNSKLFMSIDMLMKFSYFNMTMWVVLMFFGMVAFMIKLPIFGLHIWLPKAHVEAPISGSMLLAGILLKLGGYGMVRLFFILKMVLMQNYLLYMILGFMGGVFSYMVLFRQVDLKCFIAYSSVGHMGLGLGALMVFYSLSIQSNVLMFFSHGLISSALFIMASYLYDRFYSRNLMFLSGVSSYLIFGNFMVFMLMMLNLSLPPFVSFASEFMIFFSLSSFLQGLMWIILFFVFQLTGVSNIYIFIMLYHGKGINMWNNISKFMLRENFLLMWFLFLSMMILVFYSYMF